MDIQLNVSHVITDKKANDIIKDLNEMEGVTAKIVSPSLMKREYHISIDTSDKDVIVDSNTLVAFGAMIATKECL